MKKPPDDIFIALQGEAKTDVERECIDRFISMMLCLRKHKMLRVRCERENIGKQSVM